MISPDRRRQAVEQVQDMLDVSERRVCRVLGQPRSTQRYKKRVAEDEEILTTRMVELASEYGRYGYRRVTAMLRQEGWQVNHKRVERLPRRAHLHCNKRTLSPKRSGVGVRRKCRDDVAAGRPESACKTAQTRAPMAYRWLDRALKSRVPKTCLEL